MRLASVTPRSVIRREHRRRRADRLRPRMRTLREPALGARDEAGVAQAQVLVRYALAARQQAVRELHRVERRVAVDVLEPLGGIACGVLQLEHFDAALRLVGGKRCTHVRLGLQRAATEPIASSSASLVPDPTEKCAVCAASPISTIGTRRSPMLVQCVHDRQMTRGKRIHIADPRRCAALESSRWPSR